MTEQVGGEQRVKLTVPPLRQTTLPHSATLHWLVGPSAQPRLQAHVLGRMQVPFCKQANPDHNHHSVRLRGFDGRNPRTRHEFAQTGVLHVTLL